MANKYKCTTCKELKSRNNFYNEKRRIRGIKSICKDCCNKSTKARRKEIAKTVKLIPCKCGCGTMIRSRNPNGSVYYASGHYWKSKKRIGENRNQKGMKNNNWKSGIIINYGGYRCIRVPNHPRASKNGFYVPEHVLIMEEHIGRYLTKNEVVHHINGIKDDNRIENLQLMFNGEHSTLHRKKELAMKKPLFGRTK